MDKQRAWLKASRKRRLRILAVMLSVCVLFTTYPDILATLSVFASEGRAQSEGRYISGFTALSKEIREQTVPVGTDLTELTLPDTLEAVVTKQPSEDTAEKPEEEGKEDSGENDGRKPDGDTTGTEDKDNSAGEMEDSEPSDSGQENTKENNDTDAGEETGDEQDTQPGKDGESGEADGKAVTGDEETADTQKEESAPVEKQQESAVSQETHIVTMQEYHAENVIPVQTLENTQTVKQEEAVTVDGVTWQSEPEYDGSAEGIYTFTAALPEGYTLAEGTSLPQITVAVKESENGTDFVIPTLLDRIAALPDAEEYREIEPDIDNWEGDEDDYEEAYTEWMVGLQDYAKEALAILEEIGKLTDEEQALIPQEAFDKLAAWAEIAETVGESAKVMAAAPHTHDGIAFEAWTSTSAPPTSGNYYLTDNVTLDTATGYHITGTLNLCLNGKEIKRENGNANKHIFVVDGGTLNLYNCNGSGRVSLVNTAANVVSTVKGGTFNLYGGTLYQDNSGVAVLYVTNYGSNTQGGTVNIYGGSITGGSSGIGVAANLTAASVNITGGSIDSGTNGVSIQSGNATISGGTVKGGTYAVKVKNASTVTIAGNATLTNPISTPNTVIASGTGATGLTKTCQIAFTNVADGTIVVQNSTDTEHYQLDSSTYGLAAQNGNLVAVSKSKIYSVTYVKNNGTIENEGRYTSYANGAGLTLPTPTREHYTFGGWYGNSGCTGTAVTGIPTTATGNKTYYAKWTANTYTVTYNKNSGTIANESNYTSYTYGTGLTLPTPTRTGYTFGGWYENSGCTGTKVTGISTTAMGNKTYYAKWTANTYTITYNGNGSTGGSTADSSHTYGTAKTLAANGYTRSYTVTFNHNYTGSANATKTAAYTFAGWNTAADGSGTSYSNGQSVTNLTSTNNDSVTLYAKWTPQSVTYTPTREGYSFAGWYADASCSGSRVDSDGTYTPIKDMTLYAKWTPISYTISYNLDDGTVTGNPTSYTIESGAITLINPTKTGYSFGGWSGTDLTGSNNMSVTIAAGSTGHRTYTANWKLADYTVNLHTNGGTGGTDLTSYTFGTGATLPTDWTKTGYVFGGWYDNEGCTGTAVTNISGTDTGNKEYWAKWTDNIAPVIGTLTFNYQPKNFWHWLIGKDSLIITVPVTEEGSGADEISYTMTPDGGTAETKTADITGGEAKITVSADFKGTVSIVCTDKAGNTSAGVTVGAGIASNGIIIEDDAPKIAFQAENAELLPSGEYKTVPNIVVTVTDDKDNAISGGIATVSYKIGNGSEQSVAHDYTISMVVHDSFTIPASEIPANGAVITVTATDNAGNSSDPQEYTVKVHTHSGTLVPAVDPTCTTAGNKEHYTCTCGKLFSDSRCTSEITDQGAVVLDTLGHHFEGEPYIVSTTQHWRKCSRCSVTEQKEDHTFGADDKCTVCGYVGAVDPGHTHSGTLIGATEPTCTLPGNIAYYSCSSCGKWFTDSACTNEITDHASVAVGKLGHNFVGEYLFDANGHWKVCSRCNAAQTPEGHVFDDDNDTTCNKCNYQRTLGTHTHSVERTVAATEPTCTTAGNRAYYICSCGKWFSDSACTKEVTAQDVNIPAKGHTVVTDPAKAATCTETGLSEGSHCSVCAHVIKAQTVTAALGHDYSGNYHYDANGHWKVCSRCGTASAKQRHNYDNDRDTKCNDCGWVRTISDSDDEQDEQTTPPPTPAPEPESTGTPEPTEKTSETEQEQQPEGDGEQTVPAAVDNGKIVISGEPVATGNVEGMTDTETVLKFGNGAVIVTVVCAGQGYTAGVADTLAVANAVLTPEQIQLVHNGETIEIRIDVKDISDQVPEQDKEVIENGIEEYRKEVPGLVFGMYVDISMFIRIGEGDWNAITEAEEPVEIIIGIPEKLQEKDRAYVIIRAHDGVPAFMNDMDDEPGTITVSTDLFSSYAIAYVQAEGTGHKCGLCHICPTFLGICCFVWLAIIILIMIVVIILLRRKKEEQETEDTGQ